MRPKVRGFGKEKKTLGGKKKAWPLVHGSTPFGKCMAAGARGELTVNV